MELLFRVATEEDLPALVRMLADDVLGAKRERYAEPLPQTYVDAFRAIDGDPNNELIVAEAESRIVAMLQMTYIPSLTYQGAWRASIEGVRVASDLRGSGVGRELFAHAIERAAARDCHLVELTTDKTRSRAVDFYEQIGFVASHLGMKRRIPPGTSR